MGLFSGGGAGNSSSNTTTNTTSTDMSVIGGNASTNQTLQLGGVGGTGNAITLTDQGAVQGGLKLALAGIEGAYSTATQSRASSDSLLAGALSMVGTQQKQFTDTIEKVKTSDVRVMIVAGLALVAVVAFKAFGKG